MRWIYSPTCVDPTKLIAALVGCLKIASTISLSPLTVFQTPFGSPASRHSLPRNADAPGTRSEGLRITALPQAMAIEVIISGTITGQLKGAMQPTIPTGRSEEHPSELQSLMRISYAVFCL